MIVCLDVETTGLDPIENEVAQIGFVVLDDRQKGLPEVAAYSAYLQCTADVVNPKAFEVNGLSIDQVKMAPPAYFALGVLAQYRKAHILGHNVLFDLEFLRMAYSRAGMEYPGWKYKLCTMTLVNSLQVAGVLPLRPLGLDEVASYLGLTGREASTHDALVDARITADVFRRLVSILKVGV